MNWNKLSEKKPKDGQHVIALSEEQYGEREIRGLFYYEYDYSEEWDDETNEMVEVKTEDPHFEDYNGDWYCFVEYWMPIPEII